MTTPQPRFDRGPSIRLTLDADAESTPTPDFAPAVITPEGYLVATAWIARDGLLEYSDGEKSWFEYRPRDELVRCASSFAHQPVTDEHPETMVSAETFAEVARGVIVGEPTVTEALEEYGGQSFLQATIKIQDAELIERVKSGEQSECSIGFLATIVATENGFADDGTAADAVQTDMDGNHNAQVKTGRAGPAARVYLDGRECLVPTMTRSQTIMTTKTKGKDSAVPAPAPAPAKADEVGAPTETQPFRLPNGEEVQLPSVVVAMLQELAQIKQQQPAAPPAPPAAPMPAAPPPPMGDSAEEEKTMDAQAFRRREKLVRLATKAGVPEDKFDAADDAVLARAYVQARMPHMAGKLDTFSGARLDALVESASLLPEPPKPSPDDRLDEVGWRTAPRNDSLDEDEAARIAYLRKAGY